MSENGRAVEEYTEDVKEEIKEKMAEKVFSLGDLRLYECPLSYVSEDTGELIRLCYLIEDTGNLLYAGGWGNQPMWLVETYEAYKAEISRHLEKTRNA